MNRFTRISPLYVLLLLALLLYPLLLGPSAVQAAPLNWDQLFSRQVEKWIDQLSKRDTAFRDWKNGSTEVQELGAGQHQWLVHVTKNKRQIGYLIVGERPTATDAAEPQFALLEYGLGEYAPYDPSQAPAENALPIYDGLASHWQYRDGTSIRNMDASSGEVYPETLPTAELVTLSLSDEEVLDGSSDLAHATHFQLSLQETDPFATIDWIGQSSDTQANSSLSLQQLLAQPAEQRLVLNASLYHNQVLAPYTLGAVHVWNKELTYVGVWDGALRFLPYAYISRVGTVNKTM